MVIDYGKCPCGGRYEQRTVEVRFDGAPALSAVPQGACPICAGRVYNALVFRWIEARFLRSRLDNPPTGSGQHAADG